MSANWDFSVLWSTAWIGNTGWKSKVVCYATTSEDIKEHQCVKGGCNEDTARIFSVVPSDRTGSDGFKLKHRRFPLDSKKHFFTVRVTNTSCPGKLLNLYPWRYSRVICTQS